MPIIRNPFSRKNANGEALGVEQNREVDYFNKKEPPSTIDIKRPTEFKLSGQYHLRCIARRNIATAQLPNPC